MKLYEEIIFLQNFFKGKFCIENVIPYYDPLIPAQKRGRHLYWTNFDLPSDLGERKKFKNMIETGDIKQLSEFHDYDFKKYKGKQRKNKIARNLVDYEVGKNILKVAIGQELENNKQTKLF
jgi:DNA (cytosine-5)-methyltransferase 1